MSKPKICAVITENDFELATGVERFVDFYEVRLDLIGDGWQEWVKKLSRPWIACNRLKEEGGKWDGEENLRLVQLFDAVKLGARIVDLELRTPDLKQHVEEIKKRQAECLISVHYLRDTPRPAELRDVIKQEMAYGADICKLVTTATRFEDNLNLLKLFHEFKGVRLVAFAMGSLGMVSRVISPMVGGYYTYASLREGKESATGQPTAAYLKSFYEAVRYNRG